MLITRLNDSVLRSGSGEPPSLPPCMRSATVRRLAGSLGVACLVLLIPGADAATPVWQGASIHYAVNGAPLPDVLRDVLAVEGLSADIGRDVKGAVNGRFDDTPGNVFTQLVEAYGLVWYFDGKAMHVATASDVRSRVIPFAPMTREAVASLLRNLDLDDARLPIKYSASTVKVAGPSKFVDAVAQAIDNAQRQTTVEPSFDEIVIRVFPLRYAQAQDIHFTVGAREQVMPGVATLLHQLMTDTWQPTAPRAPGTRAEDAASATQPAWPGSGRPAARRRRRSSAATRLRYREAGRNPRATQHRRRPAHQLGDHQRHRVDDAEL
jgi:type III secretion protein C